MWPFWRRTKKLIVAFHFQFANQAAWKCDSCRASGLEKKRNCGWLNLSPVPGGRPVWARGRVSSETCPASYITSRSLAWIEKFSAWRLLGGMRLEELPARTVDALCILENELRRELSDGER